MFFRFCLLLMLSLPAHAYQFTKDFIDGFYWASLPISITVIDKNETRKNFLKELARESIEAWENRTGLSLWSLSDGGTNNIIRWSDNFAAETRMDPASVLAVAIRYTNGPYFAKTEVVINGNHPLLYSGIAGNFNQNSVNYPNLKTTLTHELGHTMGLDHSENWSAIMYATLQTHGASVTYDDDAGMRAAVSEMEHRQLIRYVSPLSYEKSDSQALSCGTTGPLTQASSGNGMVSLATGMLIGFVRKIFKWFKSFF